MTRNPKTPEEIAEEKRQAIMDANRGRPLGLNEWRNFCSLCGMPIIVHQEWLREKADLRCDECRPAIQTGNQMSGGFSPDRKQGGGV